MCGTFALREKTPCTSAAIVEHPSGVEKVGKLGSATSVEEGALSNLGSRGSRGGRVQSNFAHHVELE